MQAEPGTRIAAVADALTTQPTPRHGKNAVRRRTTNLVHDTMYRRARRALMNGLHGMDDALDRMYRREARVLFEAATPLSVAVFEPVLRRLQSDPRLEFWFTSCDRSWTPEEIFGPAGITARVVPPAQVRWMKFDAYVNTDFWNMTWLHRRTRRVHLFHGVAGKYGLDAPVNFAPAVATFDRLMFPNADRLQRYVAAGLVDDDAPQAALIGYPKVDCLVVGSLDRAAIERTLGLDPALPTVLYAPTWSPHSSLQQEGSAIIKALAELDVNVVVKLHDRSYDPAARASGGIDWRGQIESLCRHRHVHLAPGSDASPYLYAADVLVTDHSSVGFEFMLLDRPIVVLDCPKLVENARINPEKVALLRSAGEVIHGASGIRPAIEHVLADPQRLSVRRRKIAGDLFYQPGGAAERAARCIYELLAMAAPVAAPAQARGLNAHSGFTFTPRIP